jgi:hypothetical protein
MLHTLPATSLLHFQHQYQPKMASLGVTMGSHSWQVCTVDQAGSHTHTHIATMAHVTDSVGPAKLIKLAHTHTHTHTHTVQQWHM